MIKGICKFVKGNRSCDFLYAVVTLCLDYTYWKLHRCASSTSALPLAIQLGRRYLLLFVTPPPPPLSCDRGTWQTAFRLCSTRSPSWRKDSSFACPLHRSKSVRRRRCRGHTARRSSRDERDSRTQHRRDRTRRPRRVRRKDSRRRSNPQLDVVLVMCSLRSMAH